MAHFAEVDENNIVLRVLKVDDSEELIWPVPPYSGTWLQTSYNNRIRKNFAGIGYFYDSVRDAFIPPQPYPSWELVEETCQWASPTPKPDDGYDYYWDEENISWAATKKIIATKINLGDFNVFRMFARNAGDVAVAVDQYGMDRSNPTRISVVTKGARTHGPEDGSIEPVTLSVGDFNTALPDMIPGVRYKITALSAGTEYYCISRVNNSAFNYTEIRADSGVIDVPSGKAIFIGGGATNYGEGPIVVDKSIEDRQIQILTPVFGFIFW